MAKSRKDRIELFKGRGKQPFRYRITSSNSEKMMTGEGRSSAAGARQTATAFAKRHKNFEVYDFDGKLILET